MRNQIFFLSFFLLLCFFVKAQTPGQARGVTVVAGNNTDTTKGNVYAIIMGISSYPGINPLKYADKDAILFSDFLKSPGGGNTKPENIKLLINDSAKMYDFNAGALRWLKNQNLKKGDRLYLYFSGHGVAMNEQLYYFLPYDCAPEKDENNYSVTGNIDMHFVKYAFIAPQVARGVEVILIMDACRSNEIPGGKENQQSFGSKKFIVQQEMGEMMLLSTGPGQVSIESPAIGNGHGLFTYYLIDGLEGAADKDSLTGDNDGKVSLGEIGAYVTNIVKRKARTEFNNTIQIPYSCCGEKDLTTIVKVDPASYASWERMHGMSSDQNTVAFNNRRAGQKGAGDLSTIDTVQIAVYNKFTDALKKEKLTGELSAETFYREMEKKWPGKNLTEDAKYSLAGKFLNFSQQKINLFLSGKGLEHIVSLENELNKGKKETDEMELKEMGEEIKKLKTLVITGFDVADTMMEKAVDMLKAEPELLSPILPKLAFLKAMAAYSGKNKKMKDVLLYCRSAIAADPQSAAGYQLMGWVYLDMQDDSCEYYFRKAADMAPKWPYPVNALGNYYISKNDKNKAIAYFFKTIQMDSLCSNAYRNIGMTYFNQRLFDQAKPYFLKAMALNPHDSYANENWAVFNSTYILPDYGSSSTDSIYFKIARKFFLKSIEYDSSFVSGYQKLSVLYLRAKKEDSALGILQKCAAINPENAEAFRNLGNYYLNSGRDTVQAEISFKKAISLDSFNTDNYNALARLYRKQHDKNKAIGIYSQALNKIGKNKALFNEFGNTYFDAPSDLEKAVIWYKKSLDLDSTLDYVYLNLGNLYDIKNPVKDSSIYYFSRAVLYNPDRWESKNFIIDKYYADSTHSGAAKTYYRQLLEKGIAKKFWLNQYADRLVQLLTKERLYTEAEEVLKQYLHPDADKVLYNKLSSKINLARDNSNKK
ncbi:MAG: caspase family protein [Bacteroidota bacterium]